MKVFNYSELHFAEVTFYKIHTLADVCGIPFGKAVDFAFTMCFWQDPLGIVIITCIMHIS